MHGQELMRQGFQIALSVQWPWTVASGQIDLVVEAGLNAYDVAALIPIVRDAGGIMTDWQGKPVDLLNIGNGQILAAGSAKVHKEAMELLGG